jgi:hypothetical protein
MLAQVFEEDIEKSVLLTDEIIKKQGYWLRFKQNFSRLLFRGIINELGRPLQCFVTKISSENSSLLHSLLIY